MTYRCAAPCPRAALTAPGPPAVTSGYATD